MWFASPATRFANARSLVPATAGLRRVLCLIATAWAVWVANDTYRAAGPAAAGQTDQIDGAPQGLTCRIATPHPPSFLSPASSPRADIRHYSGTIGSRAVTMMLRTIDRDLSGHYFYATIEQPIQLRGRLTDRGYTLTEFGDLREPSNSTGTFDISTTPSTDALHGTWRSPDGKRSPQVAFDSVPPTREHRILVTWERRSGNDRFEAWQRIADYSPVRNELIYLEQPNVVAAFDLSTMRRRHLFEAATETVTYSMPHGSLMTVGPPRVYDVVVSHAGDRVAFTAGPEPFRDIYVMGIDDARQTRLTDSLGDFMKEGKSFFHYGQPKFSPDDRMLLFQILHGPVPDNNDVAVISAAGGPVQALGEGYAERAYWSADGTRVCTYSDARTARKIVYEVPSGRATVGADSSWDNDRERLCRSIADAASIETCDVPEGNEAFGAGSRAVVLSQRWVTPDVVINTYELDQRGRPGYRIQVVQLNAR